MQKNLITYCKVAKLVVTAIALLICLILFFYQNFFSLIFCGLTIALLHDLFRAIHNAQFILENPFALDPQFFFRDDFKQQIAKKIVKKTIFLNLLPFKKG